MNKTQRMRDRLAAIEEEFGLVAATKEINRVVGGGEPTIYPAEVRRFIDIGKCRKIERAIKKRPRQHRLAFVCASDEQRQQAMNAIRAVCDSREFAALIASGRAKIVMDYTIDGDVADPPAVSSQIARPMGGAPKSLKEIVREAAKLSDLLRSAAGSFHGDIAIEMRAVSDVLEDFMCAVGLAGVAHNAPDLAAK